VAILGVYFTPGSHCPDLGQSLGHGALAGNVPAPGHHGAIAAQRQAVAGRIRPGNLLPVEYFGKPSDWLLCPEILLHQHFAARVFQAGRRWIGMGSGYVSVAARVGWQTEYLRAGLFGVYHFLTLFHGSPQNCRRMVDMDE
jgi:hypothetical protein